MDDRGMDNKLSALGDFQIEGFCSVLMLIMYAVYWSF